MPADSGSRPRRRFLSMSTLTIVLLTIAVVIGVLELIPANEYMLLPGDAKAVAPMISVRGYPNRHTRGTLYMTDVSLYKVDHLLEDIYGRLDPSATLEKAQDVSGGLSDKQYQQYNVQLMAESIDKAEAAALEVTRHYRLRFSPKGPQILFVLSGTPASKVLRAGDYISAIDGHHIRLASQVHAALNGVRPGQTIHLVIRRGSRVLHVSARTVPSTSGIPTRHGKTPLIGITVQDQVVFPIKVSINAGDISGPSAGLMFSLGIIERLEGRDLARGCKVAGTGTIDYDGAVGPIGGAKQKILAARAAGAQYFLVPNTPDNRGPAQANRGDVTVVPVSTLRQALSFLNHIKPCR